MKKSNIIILKTISIISFIISIFFLLYGTCMMFDLFGIKDLYLEVMKAMGVVEKAGDAQFQVYMAIFDSIVGVFLNSYCAGMYLKISKSNNILIGTSKVLMYMGVLQCLFIISLLPGILAIVSSVMLSKSEKEIVNRPREDQSSLQFDIIKERIASLKLQKEKGEITEDQYNLALNEVLENSAKSKLYNEEKK